jgi:hypothetical protein
MSRPEITLHFCLVTIVIKVFFFWFFFSFDYPHLFVDKFGFVS